MDLIRKFTGETPLHGPAFAFGSSKTKRDVICWVPLVLFCIVMTIYQTALLIQLYQTVPTSISIAWNRNELLKLDNLILSIHHLFLGDGVSEHLKNVTDTDLAKEISLVDVPNLQRSINNGVKPNLSSNLTILMLRMFAKMAAGEKLGTKAAANEERVKMNIASGQLETGDPPYPYRWLSKDIQIHDFLVHDKIPFIPLLKTLLASVCDGMKIRIKNESVNYLALAQEISLEKDKDYWTSPYPYQFPDIISCHPSMIVYFDESTFSLQLHSPANPLVFKSADDVFQVRFWPPAQFCNPNKVNDPNIVNIDPFFILLDSKVYYDGKLMDRGNQIGMRQMYLSSSTIRIRTSFEFHNTRRSPCSETQNQFECIQKCFGNRFAANCHCWPLHKFLWKPPNIPICSETLTGTPPNNLSTPYVSDCPPVNVSDISICVGECPADCNSVDYESTPLGMSERTIFFEEQQDQCDIPDFECLLQQEYFTSAQLKAGMFSYQRIQELPTKDWQSFLNELGGLVGVWLGGSLIAFVHIPIFLFNYCKSAYQSKKKAKVGEDVEVYKAKAKINQPQKGKSNGSGPTYFGNVQPYYM